MSGDVEAAEVGEVVSDEAVQNTVEGPADALLHETDGPTITASATSNTYLPTERCHMAKHARC